MGEGEDEEGEGEGEGDTDGDGDTDAPWFVPLGDALLVALWLLVGVTIEFV